MGGIIARSASGVGLSQALKVFVQENQDTGALRPYLREMEAVTVSTADAADEGRSICYALAARS